MKFTRKKASLALLRVAPVTDEENRYGEERLSHVIPLLFTMIPKQQQYQQYSLPSSILLPSQLMEIFRNTKLVVAKSITNNQSTMNDDST